MPLSNLNAEQLAAATSHAKHNLTIASAGTGKTSTIVGRIATLLNRGVRPEKILLLTFTNKAASEMIARLSRFFAPSITAKITAGTFHATAYKYLKERAPIALKQPKELKTLFRSLYDKRVFGLDSNAGMSAAAKARPYTAEYLYDLYGYYINSASPLNFAAYISQKSHEHAAFAEIYEDLFAEFGELKKSHGYADYNDLLTRYRDALESAREPLFDEVLCDEYQDTNPLQDSILRALKPPAIFCVGDYDQSIYAFNGADISIISSFAQKYADAAIYNLSKNYRSTGAILELANRVIAHNPRIYPKSLEVVKSGEAKPPKLLIYDEVFAQYKEIAARIAAMTTPREEIAIIYRNNATADGIEAALREKGIPSRRKGGTSFFDTREVSLLLDLLALIHNPLDMMSYIHALSYGQGVGSAIAKDVYDALCALGGGNALRGALNPNRDVKPYAQRAKNTSMGLFEDFYALQNERRFDSVLSAQSAGHPVFQHPKMTEPMAKFLDEFFILLRDTDSKMGAKSPAIMISLINNSAFFRKIMESLALSRAKNKDGSLNAERLESAREGISRKVRLLSDLSRSYGNLGAFLNAMVLGSSEASEGSGVNLLSVHASKGLEFEVVFVIDLMDGRFPNRKLMAKGGSLEEERRLFYVAATRAKSELFLSYAKMDALKNLTYEPSQFLYEAGMVKKDGAV